MEGCYYKHSRNDEDDEEEQERRENRRKYSEDDECFREDPIWHDEEHGEYREDRRLSEDYEDDEDYGEGRRKHCRYIGISNINNNYCLPNGCVCPICPRGATGATGATGAKGDKGEKGEKGEKGDTGAPAPGIVASAFRAYKPVSQQYNESDGDVVISFENEQFDLANEYTSPSFIPNQDGIYSIVARVDFIAAVADPTENYRVVLLLQVNNAGIASDAESDPTINAPEITTTLSISTIYSLKAGDVVQVRLIATVNGRIAFGLGDQLTHFAAARFPYELP